MKDAPIETVKAILIFSLCALIMLMQVLHRRETLRLETRIAAIEAYQLTVNSYVEWSLSNGVTHEPPTVEPTPAE
jgi:hypothetical protein